MQGLNDRLAVDAVHEGLTYPDVIEGRLGVVDVEALLTAGSAQIDDHAELLDLGDDLCRHHIRIDDVEGPLLQADHLGGVFWDVEPMDFIDR
jgi:hypothetical protein